VRRNRLRIILMLTLVIMSFTLNSFIPNIHIAIWYLVSINIFTFFLFFIDKLYAIKNRKRIPEMSLYLFSFAGGAVGAVVGMIVTKHKIRKKSFFAFQGLIFLLWILFAYYALTHIEIIRRALSI